MDFPKLRSKPHFGRSALPAGDSLWLSRGLRVLPGNRLVGPSVAFPSGKSNCSLRWSRRTAAVYGETRHWADVPIPEKLGLARQILAISAADPEDAMRGAIGMAR